MATKKKGPKKVAIIATYNERFGAKIREVVLELDRIDGKYFRKDGTPYEPFGGETFREV